MRRIDAQVGWVVVIVLVIAPLVTALSIFRDYGESADESSLYSQAEYSLRAYRDFPSLGLNSYMGKGIIRYYGPFFLMCAAVFVNLSNSLTHNTLRTDAWHLAYFLSFQVCILGFYVLAKRWFRKPVALTTSLLFMFQPLLWGHAFINPKDIPFMAFFLGSILTGLSMQEKLFPATVEWNLPDLEQIKREWSTSRTPNRLKAISFSLLVILLLSLIILGQKEIFLWLVSLVRGIYLADPENAVRKLFLLFANNYGKVASELYVLKLVKFVNGVLTAVIAGCLIIAVFFLRRIFSSTLDFLSEQKLRQFFRDVFAHFLNPAVLLAGLTLGLTVSVRIMGPLAGIIVFLLALLRAKSRTLPAFAAYFVIAAIAMYLTWPYLWPDPFGRIMSSLVVMSEFPWEGKVLFDGAYYLSDQLPLSYIPKLFAVQFTEPVLLLFAAGLSTFIFQLRKRAVKFDYAILVMTWGILPFLAFTLLRPSLYDNFRQVLFIIPPLFLIVGLGIEKLFQQLNNQYMQIFLTILALSAGIAPIIHLHPYQYIYYNSFVGGVRGTFRDFEGDYWGTSFRDAIEYLNQVAPPGARLIVFAGGSIDKATRYARSDLVIDSNGNTRFDPATGYDFAVITTRANRDLKDFIDWPTLYMVERDDNIFALVKKRPAP